jgi:hypothetical protein
MAVPSEHERSIELRLREIQDTGVLDIPRTGVVVCREPGWVFVPTRPGDPEGGGALVLTPGVRDLRTQSERNPPSTKAGCSMTTRIVFLNGQETAVNETEDQVVQAVRRDRPNPVKLEGIDGVVLYVSWAYITSIGPRPSPVP